MKRLVFGLAVLMGGTFLPTAGLLGGTLPVASAPPGEPIRFGVIADCQYHVEPGKGGRKYSLSEAKLTESVRHFNRLDLEFVIHLGDFIDRDLGSFDVVCPLFDQLTVPRYHVLGNHDFSVEDSEKAEVPVRLGLQKKYYDFTLSGWRFVVLDGNDISLLAYAKGSPKDVASQRYFEGLPGNPPTWNGAVGAEQLAWLRQVLTKASRREEKVLLFCHFPVFPENPHNLWNSAEIRGLIAQFPVVQAYFNGHNHAGHYGYRGSVHYLTFKGMVDTTETAYAIVEIGSDRIVVTGFGREESRSLLLR
jgi:hypothetical protein